MKKRTLFVLAAAAAAVSMLLFRPLSEKQERIRVETVKAEQSSQLIYASGDGALEAYRVRRLGSDRFAEAERIYLNVGDRVSEGQVIMTLRPAVSPAVAPGLEGLISGADISSLIGGGEGTALADTFSAEQLVSPFDGIVTGISVVEGEQTSPFAAVAEVSDVSRIRARVRIGESDAGLIDVGMPASVTSGGVLYDAVVIEVSPVVQTAGSVTGASGRYCEAVLELYSPDGAVPGASASATVYAERRTGMLTLPFEAIGQDASNREYVYVLSDGAARLSYITTGMELGKKVEILSGVGAGDEVIVRADSELWNGAPVEVSR